MASPVIEMVISESKGLAYPFAFYLARLSITERRTVKRDGNNQVIAISDLQAKRQMEIARLPFLLNEERNDFSYQTLDDAIGDIYHDQRSAMSEKEWQTKGRHNARINGHTSYFFVGQRVAALGELEATGRLDEVVIPPNLATLLEWVRKEPLYSGLSYRDLRRVFTREMTFEELQQGEKKPVVSKDSQVDKFNEVEVPKADIVKLNERETHTLLKLLHANAAELVLNLDEEEEKKLRDVINELGRMPQLNALPMPQAESILHKVGAFFDPQTREEVFVAHEEDPSAQILLLHILGVDFQDFSKIVRDYLKRIEKSNKVSITV